MIPMDAASSRGIVVSVTSRQRGGVRLTAVAAVFALALVSVSQADAAAPDRSAYVPAGLSQSATGSHFVLHYNPSTPSPVAGMTIDQYAQAGLADFEEAYGHDVSGGGLAPNAGLRAPTDDGDERTDVYLAAPNNEPEFHGGVVYTDSLPWESSYVFMTPDMNREAFRFRAGHEFMHVIQGAYTYILADPLTEAFANWAAEWALPDIDPLDNNFYGEEQRGAPHPWLPLDCSYGSWKGNPCGNGYWQWLFVQAQVEEFGPAFVSGYYQRFYERPDLSLDELLSAEIAVLSGGTQNLQTRFGAYAVKVWDPTRWKTGSVARLREEEHLQPAAFNFNLAMSDSGWKSVAIDHLAARYVAVHNIAAFARAGDTVTLSWTRPAGMAGNVELLLKHSDQEGWSVVASLAGTEGSVTVPFGPEAEEVVLPLINDSLGADEQPFAYRVQIAGPVAIKHPVTRLLKHPPKRTTAHLAKFVFAAAEQARFECRLDRHREYRSCPARYHVRVKTGRHTLLVRAVDQAGNKDQTPARWTWTVLGSSKGRGRRAR